MYANRDHNGTQKSACDRERSAWHLSRTDDTGDEPDQARVEQDGCRLTSTR